MAVGGSLTAVEQQKSNRQRQRSNRQWLENDRLRLVVTNSGRRETDGGWGRFVEKGKKKKTVHQKHTGPWHDGICWTVMPSVVEELR